MPLDPYLATRIASVTGLDWSDLDDPDAAARFAAFHKDPQPWVPPSVTVAGDTAPGPHGPVEVRIYGDRGGTGTLVWVHGGAFAFGDLDMNEAHVVSAELAERTGFRVVSVGYRLAGEGVTFPVPLDDVVAAYRWARDSDAFTAPYALGGASAGASLSLAAAIQMRDAGEPLPGAVLLAYPAVHFPVPPVDDRVAIELHELPPFARFTPRAMQQTIRTYVGRITDLPTLATPGHARLEDLPPTTVIWSELDDLRSSAELLIAQLEESDVPVTRYEATGMLHGHLNRTPGLREVDDSIEVLADSLRTIAP